MRDQTPAERAAIGALVSPLTEAQEARSRPRAATVTVAGRRLRLAIASLREPSGRRARAHLRFDRVAVRLIHQLQAALRHAMPGDLTVAVTVTAPIRLPGKTAVALGERIRSLLVRSATHREARYAIHGNQVRIRFETTRRSAGSTLIGFIHNPETDPRVLLNLTSAWLALRDAATRPGARRHPAADWLVIVTNGPSADAEVHRYISSQLGIAATLGKILMVFPDGQVATLA